MEYAVLDWRPNKARTTISTTTQKHEALREESSVMDSMVYPLQRYAETEVLQKSGTPRERRPSILFLAGAKKNRGRAKRGPKILVYIYIYIYIYILVSR